MSKPIIIAAGGLVWNEQNELLMIYRMDKWDLPKGKLDEGETIEECALREVHEETGLQQVVLGEFIGITQHEYYDKYLHTDAIKESHWYSMKTVGDQSFIPQTEEDITDIKWVKPSAIHKFLQNSYQNIEIIIKQYFSRTSELELAGL
ncbi:NUDIX hydrolase [Parasediminibacterium sp. JCM 36343]|uniref:NUDIX hydrolase n=1 Tax=Parasediminibacterium sp. JCM 36343 TaxID=3374279 RepID=UPI0039791677